jgi:hypothetical protein
MLKITSFAYKLAKYEVHQLVEILICYNYEDIPKMLITEELFQFKDLLSKNYGQSMP